MELDTFTYKTLIRGIWVAVEGGEILSPERAVATIKAAVRESLYELVSWEEMDVIDIFVELLPGSKEPKQLGSLVYSLLPSAISSAISQACNKTISSIPFQSDYVYQAFSPQSEEQPLAQAKAHPANESETENHTGEGDVQEVSE